MDRIAAIDRLIYWTEAPVDVAAAQGLVGREAGDPPPEWTIGLDFGPLSVDDAARLRPWVEGFVAGPRTPGVAAWWALAVQPYVVYLLAWPQKEAGGTADAVARHAIRSAVAAGLPHPGAGYGTPVNEWVEIRRSLQKATVAYRVARLEGIEVCSPEAEEEYLARRPTAPASHGTLVGAIARHDAPAAVAEAGRLTDAFLRANVTPLASLRVRLMEMLLACGQTARSSGMAERQVDRWLDHRLRELWRVYSLELLSAIVTESVAELAGLVALATDARFPPAVALARSLLIATWNENLTAEQLAREAGIAAASLSRQFNRHVGLSIPAFRNKLRVDRAKEALRATSKSITAVALECGFNNVTHFNRVFAELVGSSPGDWRRASAGGVKKPGPIEPPAK